MAANNRLLGMGTAETLKGVMASKQEEASILRRKALYGELSAEEKARIAAEKAEEKRAGKNDEKAVSGRIQ